MPSSAVSPRLVRLCMRSRTGVNLVFERGMEIFQCIKRGRIENEQLGLTPDISNLLTPERREKFSRKWNYEVTRQVRCRGKKSSYDEMMDGDDDPPQVGRGQSPKGEKMGFDEYV